MKLRLERSFDSTPDVVWPLLTVPVQMNRWSEARVTALDGSGDVAGARRRVVVRVFGISSVLEEEVVEAIRAERSLDALGRLLRDVT